MRIQDIEVATGLDRATIRFYEKEGILKPQRAENGYRNYTQQDAELLLKIKLLRKLGIGLQTIRMLQQGEEDLSLVLSGQIEILECQIQSDTRAQEVCRQICNDRAAYPTLESRQYLMMLEVPVEGSSFREPVEKEKHPIRRFIARDIDLLLLGALISFFVIVVIRVRPCNRGITLLIQIMSYALVLPTEALMLHFWGATPGKWLMGIALEDVNGGKLTVSDAFIRTWHVMLFGLGLNIPFFSQWRLIKSYQEAAGQEGTCWDEEAEIQYQDPGVLKISGAVIAVVIGLSLNLFSVKNAVLPAYMRENLTMEQFASNVEDYQELFQFDNSKVLNEEGKWVDRENTAVIITDGNSHDRKNFQYTYNIKGGPKTISFHDSWTDIQMRNLFPDYCMAALYTAIGSRPGARAADLTRMEELLESEVRVTAAKGGKQQGRIQILDVAMEWKTELPEGDYFYSEFWGSVIPMPDESGNEFYNEDIPIPYHLEFTVSIG